MAHRTVFLTDQGKRRTGSRYAIDTDDDHIKYQSIYIVVTRLPDRKVFNSYSKTYTLYPEDIERID